MPTTMTESKLNGLALLNVYTDKHIDIDLVARKKNENAFRGMVKLNYRYKYILIFIHCIMYLQSY